MPNEGPVRVLVIGAHPDDDDIKAGGTAALYAAAGHVVHFVSVTNGDAGHHQLSREELARRRHQEAERAGQAIGITYEVWDQHDGELVPSLEMRRQMIRLIRRFRPDLVITHRPWDYHPDHRYTAQLVQDAAYMVTVPAVEPEVPHLPVNPVILYMRDHFRKPVPFQPDIVVDVEPVLDLKIEMLHAHASQFYEWLPYNGGYLHEVPHGEAERKAWLRQRMARRMAMDEAGRVRAEALYGPERAARLRYVEMFEICEYGSQPSPQDWRRLFPFLP